MAVETGHFYVFTALISRDEIGIFNNNETGNFDAYLRFLNDDGFVTSLLENPGAETGNISSFYDLIQVGWTPPGP